MLRTWRDGQMLMLRPMMPDVMLLRRLCRLSESEFPVHIGRHGEVDGTNDGNLKSGSAWQLDAHPRHQRDHVARLSRPPAKSAVKPTLPLAVMIPPQRQPLAAPDYPFETQAATHRNFALMDLLSLVLPHSPQMTVCSTPCSRRGRRHQSLFAQTMALPGCWIFRHLPGQDPSA